MYHHRILSFLFVSFFVLLAGLPVAPASAAGNVVHTTHTVTDRVKVNYIGQARACFGYRGTITSTTDGTFRVTRFLDGPRAGDRHVVMDLRGTFTTQPLASTSGAVYTGSYRLQRNFWLRDGQTTAKIKIRLSGTGDDGSEIKMMLHGEFTKDEVWSGVARVNCYT